MAEHSDEQWRPIPGFAGYEASTLGRIRSVEREVVEHKVDGTERIKKLKSRVLRVAPRGNGAPRVGIFQKQQSLPRLVLAAFRGEPDGGRPGFHDGDATNCRLDNLYWDVPTKIPREKWRSIPGYPGYEASDTGRIRVRERSVTSRRQDGSVYQSRRPAQHLSLRTQEGGSVVVGIGGREITVARLVLLAHIGPPPGENARAIHIDGDPANNRVANLEWRAKLLTADDVREIRERYHRGVQDRQHFISQGDLAREYGVPQGMVCEIINVGAYKDVETPVDEELKARGRPGCDNQGSKHGNAKLTEDDVIQMRRLDWAGWSADELAAHFGVSARHVRKILARELWKHV